MGGAILGMTSLTWVQYTICVLLGALSLPVAVASRKFLPTSKFETMSRAVDLESGEASDPFSRAYANYKDDMSKRGSTYMEEGEEGESVDGDSAAVAAAQGTSGEHLDQGPTGGEQSLV